MNILILFYYYNFKVAVLSSGEIFGEVDCILKEKRKFSVMCSS